MKLTIMLSDEKEKEPFTSICEVSKIYDEIKNLWGVKKSLKFLTFLDFGSFFTEPNFQNFIFLS